LHSINEGQVDEGATTVGTSNSIQHIVLWSKKHLTATRKEQSYKDEVLINELEDEKERWPENVRWVQYFKDWPSNPAIPSMGSDG
jgi:hypothetical protein